MKDYYQRLGVKPDAGSDELKKAYRQLSKKYHPDMYGGSHSHAEDVFKEIQEAYQTLSDESKRSFYDYQLELYRNPPAGTTYTTTNTPYYQYRRANNRPYRPAPPQKVNVFKSVTVWVALGVGVIWMVLMFMYYVNNEGKGGMDYATGFSPVSSQEQMRKQRLMKKYDQVGAFEQGIAWAYKAGTYVLIDTSGKELSKKYDWAGSYNEQVAVVKKGDLYGYVGNAGEALTELKYEFAEAVHDGIAIVQTKSVYYILHFEGKLKSIELPGVKAVGTYAEGLLPVQMANSDKWGYINAAGDGVILPNYWDVTEFKNDLAGVKDTTSHLWGYINPKGKLMIPYLYEKITVFKNGKARVKRNNKTFIIDNTNRCVADCD